MRLFEFRFTRRKEELNEELRAHLRMAVADRVERGETVDEARQNAMREMGNLPLIEDVAHAARLRVPLRPAVSDGMDADGAGPDDEKLVPSGGPTYATDCQAGPGRECGGRNGGDAGRPGE
jgi:hypothetical protein